MSLLGNWHFTALDGQRDRCGNFDALELHGFSGLGRRGLELSYGSWASAKYLRGPPLTAKTLVAWVRLDHVENPCQAGSVITVLRRTGEFDGLAFSDSSHFGWMVASDANRRSAPPSPTQEGAGSWGRLLKVAVTYQRLGRGTKVCVYRQPVLKGQALGAITLLQSYVVPNVAPETFARNDSVVHFGSRFFLGPDVPMGHVNGAVAAAQVHGAALSQEAIADLAPPLVREERAETFALVVGVQDYVFLDHSAGGTLGRSNLRGTLEDVDSYAALTRLMGVPAANIRVLTAPPVGPNDFASVVVGRERPVDMNMVEAAFGYASGDGIRAGVRWLADKLRANPASQGLVFYAGHSVTTTAGHPALAPFDTRKRPRAEAVSLPLGGDAERYRRVAGFAHRLAAAAGTRDPATLVGVFRASFRTGVDSNDGRMLEHRFVTSQSLLAALQAVGVDVSDPARRSALRTLLLDAERERLKPHHELWGFADWIYLTQLFDDAEQAGFDEAALRVYLDEDPFAADAEYTGLVSYMQLLDTALQPLPADRAVTVVLETCLPTSPTRPLDPAYAGGLPRTHGEVSVVAGCGIGQNSYAGVFDNRWHGAFTWALTTCLSHWDVLVTNAGRSFAQDYRQLLAQTGALMKAVGFTEQEPTMWTESSMGEERVFGRREWEEQIRTVEVLRSVKVKEEIDAGGTGHIFEILVDSAAKGFLVVTNGQVTANGHTWNAATEYWAWNYAQSGLPAASLTLKRPPTSPAQGTDLGAWITANNVVQNGNTRANSSLVFPIANPRPNTSFNNCHRLRRSWDPAGTYLAVLKTATDGKVTWSRIVGSPLHEGRLVLADGNNVVLPPDTRIDLEYTTSGFQVSLVDGDVVDG